MMTAVSEVLVPCFHVLSRYLFRLTEENLGKSQHNRCCCKDSPQNAPEDRSTRALPKLTPCLFQIALSQRTVST